jgi:S-adenosylmethionine:tRNA ribosyltransferase-isomerase
VSERLVTLRFDTEGDSFWSALYRQGRPVQYSYVVEPLALWDVQTPFATRPWSSEMPSAARPLAWELVLAIRARGARFASITHAAGLSSTGDTTLDAALPLRESYEVPAPTAEAIAEARARGGRVVAVGTTVVRALESAAVQGRGTVIASSRDTDLVVARGHCLRAADALFTGMHEPGTSHDALLEAFAPRELLVRAFERAQRRGFLGHEFGDSMLVGRGLLA